MKRTPFGNVNEGALNRPIEETAAKKTRNDDEYSDDNKENFLENPGTPLPELFSNIRLEDKPCRTSTFFTNDYIGWLYPEVNTKPIFLPEQFKGPSSQDKTGELAEHYVWKKLEKMQEPMLVIHDLTYDTKANHQMDFLVINKKRGIFVIEVKGSQNENISQNDARKGLEQLERDKQFIQWQLQKVQLGHVKIATILVAISNIRLDDPESELMQAEIKLNEAVISTFNDIPKDFNFSEKYEQILQHFMVFFASSRASLNGLDSKVQNVTPATLNKWGCLRPSDLTKEQFDYLVRKDKFVVISGPAGSGKTELLSLKATSEEIKDETKLIICYNKPLRDYLEFRLTIKETKEFTVTTFSQILRDLTGSMDEKRANVTKAISKLFFQPWTSFRHVFVDECQDMQIDLIHSLRPHGYFWIFHDDDHKVRYTNTSSMEDQGHRLTKVIRNTKTIYRETLTMYHPDRKPKIAHRIPGPAVIWNTDFSKEDLMNYNQKVLDHIEDTILSAARKLIVTLPGDIGIIVEDKSRAEDLKRKMVARNKPIAFTDANEMVSGMSYEGIGQVTQALVTIDSVSRVKGLEFKVAIVVLGTWRDIKHSKEKMYVAMTRSRCLLEIICCKDDPDFYKAPVEQVSEETSN